MRYTVLCIFYHLILLAVKNVCLDNVVVIYFTYLDISVQYIVYCICYCGSVMERCKAEMYCRSYCVCFTWLQYYYRHRGGLYVHLTFSLSVCVKGHSESCGWILYKSFQTASGKKLAFGGEGVSLDMQNICIFTLFVRCDIVPLHYRFSSETLVLYKSLTYLLIH